jgi:hypothetical protein
VQEIQRPGRPGGKRQYGLFGAAPGNLRRAATDWWSNEDSNQGPGQFYRRRATGSLRDRGRSRTGMEGCRHQHRTAIPAKRLHRELQAYLRNELVDDESLLATRSANPYRELAALLQPYQTARARSIRGRARRVAGWAGSNGSAGHAGAQANLKLTFQLDQSVGAVRVVALWRHGGDIKRETLRLNFAYAN